MHARRRLEAAETALERRRPHWRLAARAAGDEDSVEAEGGGKEAEDEEDEKDEYADDDDDEAVEEGEAEADGAVIYDAAGAAAREVRSTSLTETVNLLQSTFYRSHWKITGI